MRNRTNTPKKQGGKIQRTRLSPEAQKRVCAAALEHPGLGARRLSRALKNEGIEVGEGSVRAALQKLNLHTKELRLKLLEERLLNENISLSEEQLRALHRFNPCLRERTMEGNFPGLLLIQDILDLGVLKNLGRTFLHAAVDPSCCLAFAVLGASAEPSESISVLCNRATPFYQRHQAAVQTVMAGPGLAAGDATYLGFLKSRGISLAQLPPGSGRNGFVERFEGWVRRDFLGIVLQSQAHVNSEGLQACFEDWLERYNRTTPLPGYPTMGRPALEAFLTSVRPAVEADPELRRPEPAAAASPGLTLAGLPPPSPGKKLEWKPGWTVWAFWGLNVAFACLIAYFGWRVGLHLAGVGEQQPESAVVEKLQPAPLDPGTADAGKPLLPEDYQAILDRNLFGVPTAAKPPSVPKKAAIAKIALANRNLGLRLTGTVAADDPKLSYAIIDVLETRDQGIFHEGERVGKVVIKSILRNNVIIETENGDRRRLSIDEDLQQDQAGRQPEPDRPALNAAEGSTFQVSRNEVASFLSDIPRVADEAFRAVPAKEGSSNGLALGRLRPADFFYRMGMRTGDVVKGVDGTELSGPEDGEFFLQRLAQEGRVSVLIERRGKPRNLDVLIK